jgi:CheY-like chemotaxis protein/HPt (histidine-containing phosphotransfer) domain-containing protein
MSHEIRTPMTAVIGYADLLLDPSLGASERVNHLQTIRRNGEHLMTVIDDILDVSKIEAGKMTVENIPTSPSQVIVDVASLMRVRAVAKSLAFEIRYQGAIPETIHSDPTRLRQIVMNFVANAIKFTDTGTIRILVRCDDPESQESKLVLDVTDTGIGMTEAQMQRLFQSFSQADASTTRKFGGSGLGLLISKRLAQLLGGDISVESALGRGSVFRVSIPTGPLKGVPMVEGLAEAGLVDNPAQSTRRVASLPPSCRVLLAEDGYDNQVLVSTYLVKAGATVKVVADGLLAVEEATAALAAGKPYDLVLMDMQMPKLDGYGATSKLRLMKYDRPIVALTAHAMAGDRERCEKAGCDDYLTKPVDRAKLVALVARYTARQGSGSDLVSTLEDDEDMREILHQFVRDLPERSSAILRASQASDVDTLKRLAHQLKGAGGGYGFPRITEAASAVEQAIAEGVEGASLQRHVEELASLCRRARAA